MSETAIDVLGYRIALDRGYDLDSHVWVAVVGPGRVRLGLDPLGVETNGTLAQLAFVPAGALVRRGEPIGTLEAEKFVGPLVSPLSGTVVAANDAVLADPGLVHRDPLGDGWLVELAPADLDREMGLLLVGVERIVPAFEARVADYRLKGVLAE